MSTGSKPCTICNTPKDVLVRCQIDETGKWHFVCPGACWRSVSGGEEDARGFEKEYPHYRYDGPTSAKKPQKVKEKQKERRAEREREGFAGSAAQAQVEVEGEAERSDEC
ncbi:hypothetical protein PRZ48_009588 [Zasmidium cellare]|uniref:Uncharacterized protein n=1 Tax=Zasmidium cellare TaxID=395010 RepID=A0ABR0ECT8_ZASCE|nr:hypothetical protein PRZ48_009588 [Zasmidium cellare]